MSSLSRRGYTHKNTGGKQNKQTNKQSGILPHAYHLRVNKQINVLWERRAELPGKEGELAGSSLEFTE